MTTTIIGTADTAALPHGVHQPVDVPSGQETQSPAGAARVEKGEIGLCFPLVARRRPGRGRLLTQLQDAVELAAHAVRHDL